MSDEIEFKPTITPEFLEQIRIMSGVGLEPADIRDYFGYSLPVWKSLIETYPDIERQLKSGRADAKLSVAIRLADKAKQGKGWAIKFYMQAVHGWTEKSVQIPPRAGTLFGNGALPELSKDPIEASKVYQQIMTANTE